MEKIEAYKTIDGQIFEYESDAEKHEERELININRDKSFESNKAKIRQHIHDNFEESSFRIGKPELQDMDFYHEGKHGWNCEYDGTYRRDSVEEEKEARAIIESNPIDKCIYSLDLYWGDDCCVYCGEPEERK